MSAAELPEVGAVHPSRVLAGRMDDLADAFADGRHARIVAAARQALDAYSAYEERCARDGATFPPKPTRWTIPDEDAGLVLRIASYAAEHPSAALWTSALTTPTYALLREAGTARARQAETLVDL